MRHSITFLFAVAGAMVATACGPSPEPEPEAKAGGPVLPFLADDYAGALAEARSRDLPIFVENWAPW